MNIVITQHSIALILMSVPDKALNQTGYTAATYGLKNWERLDTLVLVYHNHCQLTNGQFQRQAK